MDACQFMSGQCTKDYWHEAALHGMLYLLQFHGDDYLQNWCSDEHDAHHSVVTVIKFMNAQQKY